jgi:hypothetical protein
MLKKKMWANFQRIIELFTQNIVTKLPKIWVSDPGSGIRKKPIPDPGSSGQKGTGSRIRPQHCFMQLLYNNQCCGSALASMRIRIWIQIQGFDDKKWEKFYNQKKKNIFLNQKLQFTYPWPP